MTSQSQHQPAILPASEWILRFAPLVPAGARVLDVACGSGRHGRLFLNSGCDITLIDRDLSGVADLADTATLIAHDLESGPDGADHSWPFSPENPSVSPKGHFDAVIVTNYLHRPLFPHLCAALRPDGLLLYETFAHGNERFGRPRNPDHLLAPGELLALTAPLHVIAYETGLVVRGGESRVIARIIARKGEGISALPFLSQSTPKMI